MNYLSTRGDATARKFCDILLEGLAPDGGLYLPQHYPQLDAAGLARLRQVWRDEGYAALAFEILSLYIDDIPAADLRQLCAKTYTPAVFGTRAITPLKKLEEGFYLEALSNGPTLAFKDMAMQLLGNLFEYELARKTAARARSSTSWAPPAATPAAPPNTPCAASAASACSCSARTGA